MKFTSVKSLTAMIAVFMAVNLTFPNRSSATEIIAPGAATAGIDNSLSGGNSLNSLPFLNEGFSIRYQQVYAASEFAALTGGTNINQISFAPICCDVADTATIADIRISLSTTSAAPDGLSTTFADNIGADQTLVYSGALSLSSPGGVLGGNPFHYVINLQNGFNYDPGLGNLLLEVQNISGTDLVSSSTFQFMDAELTADDGTSRLLSLGGAFVGTGIVDTNGLVTKFGFVSAAAAPEPATLAIMFLGLAGLAIARRRAV